MLTMSSCKAWVFLVCAVVFEVAGTSVMKLSQSESWILGPTSGLIAMLILIGLSYYSLSLSVRGLPVGVAYAFWEGLGLTLITVVSVLALGEHMNLTRFLALCAVLGGALLVNHGTEHGVPSSSSVPGRDGKPSADTTRGATKDTSDASGHDGAISDSRRLGGQGGAS